MKLRPSSWFLLIFAAWTALVVLGLACGTTYTPTPEPAPVTLDAGPVNTQGTTSNFAAPTAPCAIGTPCPEQADPATGALWVSVANFSSQGGDGGTFVRGEVAADQGAPNDGGTNAWPVVATQGAPGAFPWPVTETLLDSTVRVPGSGPSEVVGVQGATGGLPIAISPPAAATLPAIADQAVTTTSTALASLVQGPTGILVRANLNNSPGTIVRIGTNVAFDAGTAIGTQLEPGASFCFPVTNASGLKVMLESTTEPDGGIAYVTIEQCSMLPWFLAALLVGFLRYAWRRSRPRLLVAFGVIAFLTLPAPALAAPGVSPGPIPILSAADLPGFSSPASLAGASTFGVTVGAQAWVINQGIWSYQPACACAPDGSTCVASTPTPAACWGRSTAGYPGANTQTAWFINPSTGSDSASGLTSGAALKTDRERQRRVSTYPVTVTVNHTYLGSANVGDFIVPPIVGVGGYVVFSASAGTSTLFTGAITTATTQSGNTQGAIVDTSIPVSWTASGLLGKRFRVTSGARVGATTWIANDFGGTSKKAGIGDPQTYVTTYPPTYAANRVTLVAGDPYVIEQLPLWPVVFESNPIVTVSGGTSTKIVFEGFEFTDSNGNPSTTIVPNYGIGYSVNVYGSCMSAMSGTFASWVTQWDDGFVPDAGHQLYIDGGVIFGTSTAFPLYIDPGSDVSVLDSTIFVGGSGLQVLGQMNVFGNGGMGVINQTGDGVHILAGGILSLGNPFFGGPAPLWGTGNTGKGTRIEAQGSLSYNTTPTLTGTSGDAIIGGDAKTWSVIATNGYVSASLASALPNAGTTVLNQQPLTSTQVTTALGFTPASATANLRSFSFGANASLVNAAAQNIPPGSQTATILADTVLGIQTGPGGGTLSTLYIQFTGSVSNIAGQTVTFTLSKTTTGGVTTTMTTSSAIAATSGVHRLTVSSFTVSGAYAAGDVLTLSLTPSALLTAALTDVMGGAG
jgi:hypothetical protein